MIRPSSRRAWGLPRVAAVALALTASACVPPAFAKVPPSLRGPIATVGTRKVEAIDIQRAAGSLTPSKEEGATPRVWRRRLLDLCVDRELLAIEAERRGLPDDPSVKERVANREYLRLQREVTNKVLVPGVIPTPDEFATIKASGLYRYMDLQYILIRDDMSHARRRLADKVADRARAGGAWDSLTRLYSGHPPSAAAGGRLGVVLAEDMDKSTYADLRTAKEGDVLGPYTGPFGHDIYRVLKWIQIDDDSIRSIVIDERKRHIIQDYEAKVLEKYHFALDSTQVLAAIHVFSSEVPDSIAATLGPDGTRPASGTMPALGILARADGETVTMGDILRRVHPGVSDRGFVRAKNAEQLQALAARAILPELVVRDARDRGLDKDPIVARELRLMRDEAATVAMVERARPAEPDSGALRAYFESRRAAYGYPAGRNVRLIMFPNADSAHAALRAWNGVGLPADSTLEAMKFKESPRPTAWTVFPGRMGTVALYENGVDALSIGVRGLSPGQFGPVIQTPQGWAVVAVTELLAPRPMTYEEASERARSDWRAEKDDQWVTGLLAKLRAKTPPQIFAARLDAVRLTSATPTKRPTP